MMKIFAVIIIGILCSSMFGVLAPNVKASGFSVVATIPVGSSPHGIIYDQINGYLYVANYASGSVSVINPTTNSVVATINTGYNVWTLAYDPTNNRIYAGNDLVNIVTIIDPNTNSAVGSISTGSNGYPIGVVYDSINGYVYVIDDGYGVGQGHLLAVDPSSNTIIAVVPIGTNPSPVGGVAIDPSNDYIYVANRMDGTVSVINGQDNSLVTTVSVCWAPGGTLLCPSNGYVYVTSQGYAYSPGNTVVAVNPSTDQVVSTITVGSEPSHLLFYPTGSLIVVANAISNDLSFIDSTTNTVTGTIAVGSTPSGLAYDSANGYIYVTNYNSNTVSVIARTQTYSVTFTESGLPPGTSWNVTLNKAITQPSTGNAISFTVNAGTSNSYMIESPITVGQFTFAAFPDSGTVNIDGSSVNIAILYSTFTSPNWAGYVAVSSLINPQPVVTAVNGSWIVQSVTPTLSASFSSQWIGIGGLSGGSSLLQIGTASDSIADQTFCYAWYELLASVGGFLVPWGPPVPLLNTVKPRDVMQAEIFLDKTTNDWNITINDLTQNWHFWHILTAFKPSMLSAEWIEENQGSGIVHFANFGVAHFGQDYTSVANTNYATIGTKTANISSLCNFAVSMVDKNTGYILARPSTLAPDGTSFNVTWYGEGTVLQPILGPIVLSPANLFVTDPQGRSIGLNPSTGDVVNDIPDALYSGPGTEPQYVLIPNPLNGTYNITLVGTANGNYTLTIEYATTTQTTTQTFNGTISQQEKQSFSAAILGTSMTFYMNAGININPMTLNLGSQGNWITAYVELYNSVNVSSINVSSILLNGTVPVDLTGPVTIGDYNNDGVPDLMVKFDRQAVANLILQNYEFNGKFGTVTLTLTGKLKDGTPFQGSTTITVILPMPRVGGGKAYPI